MKLPINWLKDYIEVPHSPQELISQMTLIGYMQDGAPKEVGGDIVYDLEIRQNRPDCLSIIGLAREASAITQKPLKKPYLSPSILPNNSGKTKIHIENANLCYRFNTVTIEDITIKSSPEWLVKKLEAYGIKPINNIVDITNFVMVEIGQPLHAFDKDYIKDQSITIRSAKNGEDFIALGEKKLKLTKDDLVIADKEKIVALAGIIGGEHSGISSNTTSIILEAATYNQANIRRSSLRHAVRTEASLRLEKFLHPKLTEWAIQRTTQLIMELAGGKVIDHSDNYVTQFPQIKITLNLQNVKRIGGIEIDVQTVEKILTSLEISYERLSENEIKVKPPYFRTDLTQEADVIEEILRIYGYEKIPSTIPHDPPPKDIQSRMYVIEEQIRDLLAAVNCDEEITEPLTLESKPLHEPILLENSLNSDKKMLRTTLKYSLEESLQHQKKYKKETIQLFEIGKIYFSENNRYKEQHTLGVIMHGKGVTYFTSKGLLELLLERFKTSINIHNITIEILDKSTFYFELNLEQFHSMNILKPAHSFSQIIYQDFSLSCQRDVKVGILIDELKQHFPLINTINLGEIPKLLDNNKKSLFLKLSFHSKDNISNEDVEKERKNILHYLESHYQITLR